MPRLHDHVPPAFVPDFVNAPTDAVSVTVSPALASDQVPVLVAVWPSFTVTEALSRLITGAVFVAAIRSTTVCAVHSP